MPTNVPPQYREAEQRFREARSPQAKVAILQEMLSIVPKHKGTDHLRAQLRARMSKLMDELAAPSKGPKTGRVDPFSLSKEGGGRATLVGPANAGKTSLLAKATGAGAKGGLYFPSTQEPSQGMLPYEDVLFQLIDTPPTSYPHVHSRLYGLLRTSDAFVLVVDLTNDPAAQTREAYELLEQWGFDLLAPGEDGSAEEPELSKPVIIAANKADMDGALDSFQEFEDEFGDVFPVIMTSALEEVGIDELAEAIFQALGVIRVYPKSPRLKLEEFERERPLVLPMGSTVMRAARELHNELGDGLKYAVLWGESGKFDAQRVGRSHELADRDVIELHS